ncbi:MAG: DUF1273 domain-containing protein [Peptococcaceae bacterium]|nr:DUF1273 domain-containing protein [Peptococcaceae bacterium]
MTITKTCGFSGYRPSKLPFKNDEKSLACVHLKVLIYIETEAAIKNGYTHFISGFALGSDTYFAEAVIALRKRYPEITLEAALACETQADHWQEEDRDRYFGLLAKYDLETYVSRNYHKHCYLERNRYLVDRSQRLIAVFDGKFGGTMATVNRARAKNLELVIIDPGTLQVTYE